MNRAQMDLNTTSPLTTREVCQVLTEVALGKADLNVTRPDASLSSAHLAACASAGWAATLGDRGNDHSICG